MKPFDRLFATMTNRWLALFYFVLVIALFCYFDQVLALFFYDLDIGSRVPEILWVSNIGLGGIYFITFLLLALFFRYGYKSRQWEIRSWFLWLSVLIPNVISLILKCLLGRARPELLFEYNLYGFFGFKTNSSFWSFPSGHTTTIMGLVFGLSILFPRQGYFLMLVGLIIAFTRIILHQHFLSDVLATSYLVLIEMGLLVHWLRHHTNFTKLAVSETP